MIEQKKKYFFNNPYVLILVTIISNQVLVPLIKIIISENELNYYDAFVDYGITVLKAIIYPLEIPIIFAIIAIIIILIVFWKSLPLFRYYNEDMFFGVIYKWRNSRSMKNSNITINSYEKYCTECDALLDKITHGKDFLNTDYKFNICYNCGAKFLISGVPAEYIASMIIREVHRRFRTGEWKYYLLKRVFKFDTNYNFGRENKYIIIDFEEFKNPSLIDGYLKKSPSSDGLNDETHKEG